MHNEDATESGEIHPVTSTKVQVRAWEDSDGREREQFSTTIPKQLAEALRLEAGDELDWEIKSGSAVRIEKK